MAGIDGWWYPSRFELVSCPHHTAPEGVPIAADEQSDDGTVDWATIGPNHPGWDAFKAEAKAIADQAGYCHEYEHVVDQLERRLRPPQFEEITVQATVEMTVQVHTGEDADPMSMIDNRNWSSMSVVEWRNTGRRPIRN